MEKHQAPTLLHLPHHAISRIIFERWKLDKSYHHILPFLYTCKQIYYQHYHILYLLTPLVFGNAENFTTVESLQTLIQTRLSGKIRSVYLFKPSKFIIRSVNVFPNLVSVTICTSLSNLLIIVNKLPQTVTALNLRVTKNGIKSLTNQSSPVPMLKLETLKFSSACCMRRTNHPSIFKAFVKSISRRSTAASYYQSESPARLVCNLLARLIHSNMSTLQTLDIESVSFNQIYLALKEQRFNFKPEKKLELIKIDQGGLETIVVIALFQMCKEVQYMDNHLGIEHITRVDNNGRLVEKHFATRQP